MTLSGPLTHRTAQRQRNSTWVDGPAFGGFACSHTAARGTETRDGRHALCTRGRACGRAAQGTCPAVRLRSRERELPPT